MQQEMLKFSDEKTLTERFNKWMAEGGDAVYREFVAIAKQLRAAGHEHYGAKSIFEYMRFNCKLNGKDAEGYKCNNTFVSLCVRRLIKQEPDMADMFELRVLKAE